MNITDNGTRLVINPITRTIAPKYRNQKAVYVAKGDRNSTLITFEIPRYVDGNDMSDKENVIQIHYVNMDAEDEENISRGFSDAINIKVEQDETTGNEIVSFAWLIPNTATRYAGVMSIGITFERYENIDNKVEEAYSWSTSPFGNVVVLDSHDNSDEVVGREYNYLVETCNAIVKTALKEAKDSGEFNGVDGKDGKDADLSPLSNALKGNPKEEHTLTITDTSPIEHNMRLRVESENTFNPSVISVQPVNNKQCYISEVGSDYFVITSPNTSTVDDFCDTKLKLIDLCPSLKAGDTVVLSAIREEITNLNAKFSRDYIYSSALLSWDFGKSKTLTKTQLNSTSTIKVYGSTTPSAKIKFKLKIEKGTTASGYTPFVDLTKVIVTREEDGKAFAFDENGDVTDDRSGNLVSTLELNEDIDGVSKITATEGGNTVTIDTLETGVEGIAHLSITNPIRLKAGTTYYFKVEGEEPPRNEYGMPLLTFDVRLNEELSKGTGLNINEETEYTPSEDGDADIFIMVEEGAICNNPVYTLYCTEKTKGAVNSLYPNNTFISDTEGVIISAEYNRDINKAFKELEDKIAILSAQLLNL